VTLAVPLVAPEVNSTPEKKPWLRDAVAKNAVARKRCGEKTLWRENAVARKRCGEKTLWRKTLW